MLEGCVKSLIALKKKENMSFKSHVHDVQITRESPNYRIG